MAGTKEHVLVTLWIPEEGLPAMKQIRAKLPQDWTLTFVFVAMGTKAEDVVPLDEWAKATILLTHFSVPESVDRIPNVKWIQTLSARVEHIFKVPGIQDSTISVTSASGVHGPPIAEWVTMATLALSRQFSVDLENQKAHSWKMPVERMSKVSDWAGKRVGIAGYGSIGRQIARVFKALGSEIHALTASPRTTLEARGDNGYIVKGTGDPDGSIPTSWYSGSSKADLRNFLGASLDLVVVCLPNTPQTRGAFGKEEFKLLGPACTLVNIASGDIIDQPALIDALNGGVIRAAALDVVTPEPLPADSPLWDAKNCIISPHASSIGIEYMERALDLAAVNIGRWDRQEEPLINVISHEKAY